MSGVHAATETPTDTPAAAGGRRQGGGLRASTTNARGELVRARLLQRMQARRAFIIGPAGTGKSTLLRHSIESDDGASELIELGPDHSDPEVLERAFDRLLASSASTIAIDNAQQLAGSPAERVLERYVLAQSVRARLIVASQRPPGFAIARAELAGSEVIDGRDLALRLDEIAPIIRLTGHVRVSLETARAVLDATGGWPAAVKMLAASMRAGREDAGDADVLAALHGDRWFELAAADDDGALSAEASGVLARAAAWPQLTRDRLLAVRGTPDAMADEIMRWVGARVLDVGRLGERGVVMPAIVRRRLTRLLGPGDRATAARAVAGELEADGSIASAAAVLAELGARPELPGLIELPELLDLSELIERSPALLSQPGSCAWALCMRATVPDDPWIRLATCRALVDDRAGTEAIRLLDARPCTGRTLLGDAQARRSPALDTAAAKLRNGDVLGAVRTLRRVLRASERDPATQATARLILIMARAATAGPDDTNSALLELEKDAVAAGLTGFARIVRGALAATSTALDAGRQLREAAEACEDRGDATGALIIESLGLLTALRAGNGDVALATQLADRFGAIGSHDVAAWIDSAAALIAASTAHERAESLIERARERGAATGVPAIGVVADAALALLGGPGAGPRAATAHARAREIGLPRLPSALWVSPAGARAVAPAAADVTAVTAPEPELGVRCFGEFRLSLDGRRIDLAGVRPQAALLIRMLAVNAGAPVHRELISEIIWGELPLDSAVHALHVSVSALRRALDGRAPGRGKDLIERHGDAYALRFARRSGCDLAEFDDRLTAAADARARGDTEAVAHGLARALDLYTGDVLPEDGPAEWVVGARDRYRGRASEAAASLAHAQLRLGDSLAAVAAAERAVQIDPLRDGSWRALVTVHRRLGDQIATRSAERGYRRMLASLGIR